MQKMTSTKLKGLELQKSDGCKSNNNTTIAIKYMQLRYDESCIVWLYTVTYPFGRNSTQPLEIDFTNIPLPLGFFHATIRLVTIITSN
jgi:hypothetical protein